jgi:hypothetical protein
MQVSTFRNCAISQAFRACVTAGQNSKDQPPAGPLLTLPALFHNSTHLPDVDPILRATALPGTGRRPGGQYDRKPSAQREYFTTQH